MLKSNQLSATVARRLKWALFILFSDLIADVCLARYSKRVWRAHQCIHKYHVLEPITPYFWMFDLCLIEASNINTISHQTMFDTVCAATNLIGPALKFKKENEEIC